MSDELVRFLQARFTEDAARQQDIWEQWHHRDCEALPQVLYPDRETGACDCGVPARVLAEVEAKRQVLNAHPSTRDVVTVSPDGAHGFGCATCHQDEGVIVGDGWCVTLRALASVYASHPDYRAEWRAGEDTP